jgi:hypothetical protein
MLRREQEARIASLDRHVTRVHGRWEDSAVPGFRRGVLAGLRMTRHLRKDQSGNVVVVVSPGIAVDRDGQYLGIEKYTRLKLADPADRVVVIVRDDQGVRVEDRDQPPPASAAGLVVVATDARAGDTVTLRAAARLPGLAAGTVASPDGSARVVLGGGPPRSGRVLTVVTGDQPPVTTIDEDRPGHVRAHVRADLTAPSLQADGLAWERPGTTPTAAEPWALYRARVERSGVPVEQLRAELGEVRAGVDPSAVQLRVLQAGAPVDEQELLCVDATRTVTVPGKLVVTGTFTVRNTAGLGDGAGDTPTTLPDLAEEAADAIARAQLLLAARANIDLRVEQESAPAVAGDTLRYTVALVSGPGVAISAAAAYETVVAGNQARSKRFLIRDLDLAAGARRSVSSEVDVTGVAAGTPIVLTVLAIGVGPDGEPRTATSVATTTR